MSNKFLNIIILLFVIIIAGCSANQQNVEHANLSCGFNVGEQLCDIPLVSDNNLGYSIRDFKNRNIIIHFVTAWSQDSCELAGVSSYLQNQYENANVIIVLLETYTSYEVATVDFADEWINDWGVNVPVYIVPQQMHSYFPDRYFPITYVVNKHGIITATSYSNDLVALINMIDYSML